MVLKRRWLKPSYVVPVSFRVTAYEDHLLRVLAAKCGVSRSMIVRVAVLRLITSLLEDGRIVGELPTGYEGVLRQLGSEAKEILEKCVDKLQVESPTT